MIGTILGIVTAKIFGIAGILGLVVGYFSSGWTAAIIFGLFVGVLDYFVIAEVNPSIGSSDLLGINVVSAFIIGPIFSVIGMKFKRSREKEKT